MALDLTVAAGPILGTRSRLNTDARDFGTLTADEQQLLVKRIVDGDRFSLWNGDTASDAATNVITGSFNLREAIVPQDIDFVAMQNINLKNFILEYSVDTGANFLTVPGFNFSIGVADNAASDIIKSFSTITPDLLRLTMFRTFVVNDVKRVGGIYASENQLQIGASGTGGMRTYKKRFRQTLRRVTAGDGSVSEELILRSAVSYEHYGAQVELELIPKADRDTLRGIKRVGGAVTWIPEPFAAPEDVFTTRFRGAWNDRFESKNTLAGYRIGFNMEEIGRL